MVITDEMIEKANAALYAVLFGLHEGTVLELRAKAMRAALEAALTAAPHDDALREALK